MSISEALKQQTIARAKNCCEYCGLSQVEQEATFHVDHIYPISKGGKAL
jgi:hypothetical protein